MSKLVFTRKLAWGCSSVTSSDYNKKAGTSLDGVGPALSNQ